MTAADVIAQLDRQLSATGTSVTVKRGAVTSPTNSATVLASVRGHARDELAGGASQDRKRFVISPTGMIAASWPDEIRRNDWVAYGGKHYSVLEVEAIRIAGTIVRYNVVGKG